MTPNFLELAKQGNVKAITALINCQLQPKGITVEANLTNGCLHIFLESQQVPNQQSLVAFIHKGLINLRAESIERVVVYGQQAGKGFPDWAEEFELREIQPSNLKMEQTTQSMPFNVEVRKKESSLKEQVKQRSPIPPLTVVAEQQSDNYKFLTGLRTFQFSSVVPYKDALNSDLYSSNTVRLLLFFGLFPLAVKFLIGAAGLEQTAWTLGIYYSSIWGVVLYNLIKPAQFSWSSTLKCVMFTALVGIQLLLFIQQVPPFTILYSATNELGLIPKITGFVLGVGVLEELCKALPIYLFLLRTSKLKEPLTSAFYGAMSGLGFAIAEGVSYSVSYALGLVKGELDFSSYVLISTIRFITLPLNHAIWAGIVSYFLGLAALNPSRQAPIIFIGVAISAVLHGLYDTFANDLLGLAILAFSILLFVTYLRRSKQMVDEMQQAEMSYQALHSGLPRVNSKRFL